MTESYKTFTLITGASGGFGAEFARLCAADGRNLILVARSSGKLDRLARELRGDITVHTISQDLATPEAAQHVYRQVRRFRAVVDQLINNAGMGDFAPLRKAVPARQERMINLNITTLTLLTNLLLPDMLKRGHGQILNIGSATSFAPSPGMGVYAASKAYVLSFSEALSAELKGTGVTVTCLCPGAAKTSFSRNAHLPSTHPIAQSHTPAHTVAAYGYRAMLSGAPLAIPGFKNKMFVMGTKLLPRPLIKHMMHSYNNI